MRHASIAELKARLSEYVAAAKRGDEVIVTDRGKPVARLIGLSGSHGMDARLERMVREGLIRPSTAKLPSDFLIRPRPQDPAGLSLKAILEEREHGR